MPTYLFAGHAANVEFWAGEVAHCLSVIDSYEARFDRMIVIQQQQYQAQESSQVLPGGNFIPPRLVARPGRIPEQHRNYVRRELCSAFIGFATACHVRAHTDAAQLHALAERMSLSLGDVPKS